jgi:hypothetical protein
VIAALSGVQRNVTVTFELFHPAAFGAGESDAVITGGPAEATVRFVEKATPLSEPVIAELPGLSAVVIPLVRTVAAVELVDIHVANEVISRVTPSE